MNALILPLAEQFMAGQMMGKGISFPSENKLGLGLMALSGILLTSGIGLTIYGSYLWLSNHYSPDTAFFLTGLVCFAAAFLVIATLCGIAWYRKAKLAHIKKEVTDITLEALNAIEEEISMPVQENPKTAVLIASILGFVAGNRIL